MENEKSSLSSYGNCIVYIFLTTHLRTQKNINSGFLGIERLWMICSSQARLVFATWRQHRLVVLRPWFNSWVLDLPAR